MSVAMFLLLFTLDVVLKDADLPQEQGTLGNAGHAHFFQPLRQM